jgi:uncharacterized membrane protein (Fun14 family)
MVQLHNSNILHKMLSIRRFNLGLRGPNVFIHPTTGTITSSKKGKILINRATSAALVISGTAYMILQRDLSACQPGDKESSGNQGSTVSGGGGPVDNAPPTPDDKKADIIMDKALDLAARAIMQLGISGILGVCSGYAVKRLGKEVMFVGGSVFIFAQSLAFVGWISIHYSKIFCDVGKLLLDVDRDGKVDFNDVKAFFKKALHALTVGLPSTGSFYYGFTIGLNKII